MDAQERDKRFKKILKSKAPLFIRYHGFSVAFAAMLLFGITYNYFDWSIRADASIFCFIVGFGAGSFYTELYKEAKNTDEKRVLKDIENFK